jgi:hypothetical protein
MINAVTSLPPGRHPRPARLLIRGHRTPDHDRPPDLAIGLSRLIGWTNIAAATDHYRSHRPTDYSYSVLQHETASVLPRWQKIYRMRRLLARPTVVCIYETSRTSEQAITERCVSTVAIDRPLLRHRNRP